MRPTHIPLALALLVLLAAACTPRVARLSLGDRRLPVDARRWLADAEDEVSIARADIEEAQRRLDEAQEFRRFCDGHVAGRWPSSAAASGARERLSALARERLQLARLELRLAERRQSLARARLALTRAETAVRHDLRSYDLDPLQAIAEAARREVAAATEGAEAQRVRVDEATTGFWEAYGAHVRSGGRNDVLWGWGE